MSFLGITIPATLILAAVLLCLVLRAVRRGEFDDFEGPAARLLYDDDACPEVDASTSGATQAEPSPNPSDSSNPSIPPGSSIPSDPSDAGASPDGRRERG